MADNMSSEQRSFTMSRIRSRGNKTTEKRLEEILRAYGVEGWKSQMDLVGKPDFVFKDQRLAVFVDGCFWHGCPKCRLAPKTNVEYWTNKIRRNRKRDRDVKRILAAEGWMVKRIWEHSLKSPKRVVATIKGAIDRASTAVNGLLVEPPKSSR